MLFKLLAVGCAVEVICVMVSSGANPLRPLGFKLDFFEWTLTAIGAVALAFVYVRAYLAVKHSMEDIKTDKPPTSSAA